MIEDLAGSPSLIAERGATHHVDAFVVDILWLGRVVAVACGDGRVRFLDTDGHLTEMVAAHQGAILAAAPHPDGQSVLSGGDDGRLMRAWPSGGVEEIAVFRHLWVEHVATSPASGVIACGVGKEACLIAKDATHVTHRFAHPSSVGGIAIDAKGRRLAVGHYGGVSLWWTSTPDAPSKALSWRGSHLSVTFSPDSRFVVSAMQESALHGWRVADGAAMHMSGYPAKTRSFAWDAKGRRLMTGGSDRVVGWPFTGRDGPMKKQPAEIGPGGLLVTRVACHPRDDLVAAGYEDGSVLLLSPSKNAWAVVQVGDGAPVSALAWSPSGEGLAAGSESGRVGLLPFPPPLAD